MSTSNYLFFEGICYTDNTIPTTPSDSTTTTINATTSHADIVNIATFLDLISILIYILGIFYIREMQEVEVTKRDKSVCRASDYTIEIHSIPEHTDHTDLVEKIKKHLETILSNTSQIHTSGPIYIADINIASAYYPYLKHACIRGTRARALDYILAKLVTCLKLKTFNYNDSKSITLLNTLKKALYRYEKVNDKCHVLQHEAAEYVSRIYVTFETEEGYLRCLHTFSTAGIFKVFQQDKALYLDNQPVVIRKSRDPSDIRWENLGVPLSSRILRVVVTLCITLGVLMISYVMIFEALTLSDQAYGRSLNIACDTYKVSLNRDPIYMASVDANTITYDAVLRDHNWQAYNQSSNYAPSGYLLCYCQQIDYELGSEALKSYDFFNVQTGTNERWCKALASGSGAAQYASYAASFIIVIINTSLLTFLQYLAEFECHPSASLEVVSVALKLSFAQYVNTGLLSLFIYGDLTNLGVQNAFLGKAGSITFGLFTGTFRDFSAGRVIYCSIYSTCYYYLYINCI
jgi:hypothetical protein